MKLLNDKLLLKNITINIVILLISVLVSFLICEFLVRILPIQRFDKTQFGVVRPHLTRGFEFIPNVSSERWGVDWKINSEGFRDYEHQVSKRRYRILGLGDSMFVGHEVSFEDSFLRQLEKSLNIEVIKMAVTNYGTAQERLLWEEEGKKYDPDLVLLGVYVGNDLNDNVAFPDARCIDDGHFVRCGDPSYMSVRLARSLAKYSLFARLILQRFHSFLPQEFNEEDNGKLKEEDSLFKNLNSQSPLYQKKWPQHLTKGFKLLEENMLKLNRSTTEHEALLIVVTIPTEIQIYDWQWDEYLKRFSSNDSEYDRYRVINLLVSLLEEKKIHYINLLPTLKKAAETDQGLHPEHWHWSVKANKLVADNVEDYLKHHKLIPLN